MAIIRIGTKFKSSNDNEYEVIAIGDDKHGTICVRDLHTKKSISELIERYNHFVDNGGWVITHQPKVRCSICSKC